MYNIHINNIFFRCLRQSMYFKLIVPVFVFYLTISPFSVQANFEDTRCRCTCPSTEYFSSKNKTTEHSRRYYTKTNLNSANCNAQTVVKQVVLSAVDTSRLDAFLANCNCRFESRNSLLLKVVVIFVICVLFGLGSFMLYLVVVEPMLRREQPFIPYRRHGDDDDDVGLNTFWFHEPSSDASDTMVASDLDEPTMEENIFASPTPFGIDGASSDRTRPSEPSQGAQQQGKTLRQSDGTSLHERVLNRVVTEQNKWMSKVEEQRRNVMDHSVLN